MAQAVRRRGRAPGRSVLTSGDDTIAAVSSGAPPAGIAVIRVSGPHAITAATALAGSLPPPRQAGLRALRDREGDLLDRALVLGFPGPDSVTGEDVVELHCHGGRAVVEAVERALHATGTVRRAEPGEFTRRALRNGRIDLTEAVGLADLLEAETETQRRAALVASEGQVGRAVRGWLDRLAALSARTEVLIDYADEDVDSSADELLVAEQQRLATDIAAVVSAPPVERWRDGIRIVVAGPPNAGKSTLVNLLGGRDAAIVSPIAGTTRDRIEVTVRRAGVGYVLIDTAGLRDGSDDPIERSGMTLAQDAVDTADLVLWMGDDAPPSSDRAVLWLHGRADLPERRSRPIGPTQSVSAADASTIEAVWQSIEVATSHALRIADVPLHRAQWETCHMVAAVLMPVEEDLLLRAEQLRQGRGGLAKVLGEDATEAMLDSLFSRFCLGK